MHIIKWIPKDSTPNKIRKKLGFSSLKAVVCCCIFLSAALIKLLAPQATEALRGVIFGHLDKKEDYVAALATLGEGISDTEKLTDAFSAMYVTVFGSNETETVEVSTGTVNLSAKLLAPGDNAVALLRQQAQYLRRSLGDAFNAADDTDTAVEESSADEAADQEPAEEVTQTEEESVEASAPITMEYEFPDMEAPEGASLDYVNLNIDNYALPVNGAVTSQYGYRQHPISGDFSFHSGLDIAGNEGDDVYCFADGYVRAAGEHPNLGKYLIITHANGVETIYGHLSDWHVTEGSDVVMGQLIAAVGQTGAATGPHLHLEIYKDGIKVNPLYYFDL